MKYIIKLLPLTFVLLFALGARAQDARALIKQGLDLNNAHNYTAAIEKYKAALAMEPDNATANYQLAFSLNASGKGIEAVPYLQKVVQSGASATVISSAYGLMGGIYDQNKQPQKAIDSYLQAIKIDTANYALHYGLGLAYFRNHQYAEAEQSAVAALRIDPQQAGSMRLYALVTFHQNKRAAALLGLCSFLWLEPNGTHSAEANENLQHILEGGTLKAEPGVPAPRIDASTAALNQAIAQAVATTANRRYMTPADLFAAQLQAVFTAIGTLSQKQNNHNAFFKQLSTRYYQLAQSPHMPAFSRYIKQGVDKSSAAWLKVHPQEVEGLGEWMRK